MVSRDVKNLVHVSLIEIAWFFKRMGLISLPYIFFQVNSPQDATKTEDCDITCDNSTTAKDKRTTGMLRQSNIVFSKIQIREIYGGFGEGPNELTSALVFCKLTPSSVIPHSFPSAYHHINHRTSFVGVAELLYQQS